MQRKFLQDTKLKIEKIEYIPPIPETDSSTHGITLYFIAHLLAFIYNLC